MSIDPTSARVAGELPIPGEVRSRTGMTRLSFGLIFIQLAWSLPFSGTAAILIAGKLAQIDPTEKVGLLAAITVVGSVIALLANLLFGALSDMTRSRLGSRTPWVIIGGVMAAVAMFLLSTANSFPTILLFWCLFQFGQNALISPAQAILPERVPVSRRGSVSAVAGIGVLAGITGGPLVAAQFLGDISAGMRVFSLVILVLPFIGVLLAPDFDNRGQRTENLEPKPKTRSFSLPDPRKQADFYWVLIGRLFVIFGYFMVNGYVLYILTDYIKLSVTAAGGIISIGSILALAGNLVGSLVAGPVSDRLGRRKLPVIVATVLFAIAIAIPLAIPTAGSMLAFYAIGSLGFGAYGAVDAALITQVLPNPEARGKDLAVLNTSNTMGQILAPVGSAALVGLGIGFLPVFVAGLAVCLLGAGVIIPIRSVK